MAMVRVGRRRLPVGVVLAFAVAVATSGALRPVGALGAEPFVVSPGQGVAGSSVAVSGGWCLPGPFVDGAADFVRVTAPSLLVDMQLRTDALGDWAGQFSVPSNATPVAHAVSAVCVVDGLPSIDVIFVPQTFTVTADLPITTTTVSLTTTSTTTTTQAPATTQPPTSGAAPPSTTTLPASRPAFGEDWPASALAAAADSGGPITTVDAEAESSYGGSVEPDVDAAGPTLSASRRAGRGSSDYFDAFDRWSSIGPTWLHWVLRILLSLVAFSFLVAMAWWVWLRHSLASGWWVRWLRQLSRASFGSTPRGD